MIIAGQKIKKIMFSCFSPPPIYSFGNILVKFHATKWYSSPYFGQISQKNGAIFFNFFRLLMTNTKAGYLIIFVKILQDMCTLKGHEYENKREFQ